MAWSDEARAAALEARRRKARQMLYGVGQHRTDKPEARVHLTRKEMAQHLRDMRKSSSVKGYGVLKSLRKEGKYSADRFYTNVKGAYTADQGLKGTAWRKTGSRPAPSWSALRTKFSSYK